MIKITGLDGFARQIEDAQTALSNIDGEIGAVRFDPNDPGSIEAAIQGMELMLDERVGQYASNPMVGSLIEQMKEHYREAIIEKASHARMAGDQAMDEESESGDE